MGLQNATGRDLQHCQEGIVYRMFETVSGTKFEHAHALMNRE